MDASRNLMGDSRHAAATAPSVRRRYPIGAEIVRGRGTHFRVWAPAARGVAMEIFSSAGSKPRAERLREEGNGYFSGLVPDVGAGARYRFDLGGGRSFPDPASRCQPDGPHGASEVIDPEFGWADRTWRGHEPADLVIYELHLGTFTREGTWRGATERLADLARLGVTMLEVMPVAEFPGRFGWGYDGVDLFAPTRLYGRPEDARAFVNRAHELGLAVILDVVYNHLGPDGNYLREFSAHYFSSRYVNEWGDALNFDSPQSGPVREFFVTNARYWIDEFHFDGLRFDATQQMFDASPTHVLADIVRAARAAAGERRIFLVGENEAQHAVLARPIDRGGCGLDALWNDDFHHTARVAGAGRAEAYCSDYRGTPQEFVSAAKRGFLFQGQWHQWQKRRRGHPALDLAPTHFVTFLQNHDQIANSLRGVRLHQLASPGIYRALTAVLLLGRQIPMLFQGDEFAASAPFLYFADHEPALAVRVREGRGAFLQQFGTIACDESRRLLADPGAVETFAQCRIDWDERERHAPVYRLHADLLRLRRDDPVLRTAGALDGAVLGPSAFVLRYFSADGASDRLLLVNLGVDVCLRPAPEPLLAPHQGCGWRILWSSEAPDYGGGGTPPLEATAGWMLPGHAAVLLAPDENSEPATLRSSEKD